MDRKDFLKWLGLLPLSGAAMNLKDLKTITTNFTSTDLMPVLFVGHGNPMHGILQDEFTNGWQQMGKALPKPNAIICISAHWETAGTFVTAMEQPKTIHDFGGFPKELFEVQYPAPGNPTLAKEVKDLIKNTSVELDHQWGLDHGTWTVVKHLYPKADIPVLQLSLDYRKSIQWHYDLAKELATLRRKGVLIIGSGDIVHNLYMADWQSKKGFDWAEQANEKIKNLILNNDHKHLINYTSLGKEVQLAIPSVDHYLPLIYSLGLKNENEKVSFFNDKIELGSISMTSMKIS